MARPPEKPSYGPAMEPEEEEENEDEAKEEDEDGNKPVPVAPPSHMTSQEDVVSGPSRIVDRQQAPIWLQQGRLEMIAAKKLAEAFEGFRALPAACVWHCEQVVEMAIKAAMLRTCGVSEDESIGGSAHDIAEFVRRLKGADAQTEEQRLAQQVPVTEEDVIWLKRAYLASRYPRPGDYRVPSENYHKADAERALKLAEDTLKWATDVEDLPDPGITKKSNQADEAQATLDIRKRRWADMVGTSGTATNAEKASLQKNAPAWSTPSASSSGAPGKASAKFVVPPPKTGAAPPQEKAAGFAPPQGKFGMPEPKGAPKAVAPPGKYGMPEPKGAPSSWGSAPAGPPKAFGAGLSPSSEAPEPEQPATGNRWNRHKAAPPAGPPPAAAGGAAAGGAAAGGEKRGGYEDRVSDLKERLKMRKLGKAKAP